jgi:hypothetical protein
MVGTCLGRGIWIVIAYFLIFKLDICIYDNQGYFFKNLNPPFTQEFLKVTTHPNLITGHL